MSRGQVTTAIGTSLNDVFNQAYLGNSQQQEANKTYNALSHAAGQGLLGSYQRPEADNRAYNALSNAAVNSVNPYK